MGTQYTAEQESEDLARAEVLVATVGDTQDEIHSKELAFEEEIRPAKERLALESDALAAARDEALNELATIVERLLASPRVKGKSIQFRSGTVSVREATALEVNDDRLLVLAKRLGLLNLVSVRPPRQVRKNMLGKLLDTRPELLRQLSSAVTKLTTRRMTVKPVRFQSGMTKDLHPLRTNLS